MSDEEKDYENIPADEWDYDESDLLTKLDAYLQESFSDTSCEEHAKICNFVYKYHILDLFYPIFFQDEAAAVLKYAETGKKKHIIQAFQEIFDMTFYWDEDDECFYEDVVCL